MNSSPTEPTEAQATPCDGFQQELSATWDDNRPLSPTLTEHLASCPSCTDFYALCRMEHQLRAIPALDPALTARYLASANSFLVPSTASRRTPWLARVATVVALVSLSWWLLDPKPRPSTHGPFGSESALALSEIHNPTSKLGSHLSQMDASLLREQNALSDSLFDGLAHVQKVLLISHSVLP